MTDNRSDEPFQIGIAGIGLIGGSLAKAAKRAGMRVCAWNRSKTVERAAVEDGSADCVLDGETVKGCKVVFAALPPDAVGPWVDSMAGSFAPGTIVADCAGVKRAICAEMRKYATGRDWTFVGGHPMAGRERGGYGNSTADLFDGASFIFTPYPSAGRVALDILERVSKALGFAQCVFTTPEEHDEMIALTSQLAHVVSSAYARDPAAPRHRGYSAGSFADMTRVACVDPALWTSLFLSNADFLSAAVGGLVGRLEELKAAIDSRDAAALRALLEKGAAAKALL